MGAKGQAAIQAGGLVTEILYAGAIGLPPTQTEMTAWIQKYGLYVSVVKPKDAQTMNELVSREWTYVIDLKTMKIVWKQFGSYDGSSTSVDAGLTELHTLLGK